MRVSLVVNLHRPDAVEAAKVAVRRLRHHKVTVEADATTAEAVGVTAVSRDEIGKADLVIAFGGDGTIIRAALLCSEYGTPILGVYYGRFGFVTQCNPEELGSAISAFVDGENMIEPRMMLQADLHRNGHVVATIHALNECVLQRTVTDRMLTFEVQVNNRLLTRYPADGVLVSTPTGSTGYNLSAGGPIIDPSVQVMTITALAPHTLSARPLVLGPDSVIQLRLEQGSDAVLSGDSQSRFHLISGDMVEVKKSPRVTNLVTLGSDDFLEKLSNRLLWSHSILGRDSAL